MLADPDKRDALAERLESMAYERRVLPLFDVGAELMKSTRQDALKEEWVRSGVWVYVYKEKG